MLWSMPRGDATSPCATRGPRPSSRAAAALMSGRSPICDLHHAAATLANVTDICAVFTICDSSRVVPDCGATPPPTALFRIR